MRIIAYAQMLESYKSVHLKSMAHAFGISVEFLDKYFLPGFFFLCAKGNYRDLLQVDACIAR